MEKFLQCVIYILVISLQVKSSCMIFRYILLTGLLLVSIGGAVAQDPTEFNSDLSQIKIEELSDEQILQIRQRAEESGLTEAQMKAALIARGFPPNELNELEDRLRLIDSGLSTEDLSDRSRVQDTLQMYETPEWDIEFEPGPESRIFVLADDIDHDGVIEEAETRDIVRYQVFVLKQPADNSSY